MEKIIKHCNSNNDSNSFAYMFTDYTVINSYSKSFLRRNFFYFLPIVMGIALYFYTNHIYLKEEIKINFYPSNVAKKQIIKALRSSKESIYITDYTLKSYDLAQYLKEAYRKKIKIFYLIDRTALPSPLPLKMKENGIDCFQILVSPNVARSNLIITDEKNLLTSQFNYNLFSEKLSGNNYIMHVSDRKTAKNLIYELKFAS